MYIWLGSYTEGDASRMVTSMGEAKVMETYRLMFEQATPASTNQIMRKRSRVMGPIGAKTWEDVPKQITAWKGIRREYEELAGKVVDQEEVMNILLGICPETLQDK